MTHQILVCQNRTCRKQGSTQVLETLQGVASPDTTIQATGCLGRCGSGAMVVILPEEIWYTRVEPKDVATVIQAVQD